MSFCDELQKILEIKVNQAYFQLSLLPIVDFAGMSDLLDREEGQRSSAGRRP